VGRFFLDENVQGFIARPLRDFDHEVITAQEAGSNASSDDAIMVRSRASHAVLITTDLDFANVLRFPVGTHSGIVVLRLKRLLLPKSLNGHSRRFPTNWSPTWQVAWQ
jgi:predicted nuclease of predicted toxin-antitoxin system